MRKLIVLSVLMVFALGGATSTAQAGNKENAIAAIKSAFPTRYESAAIAVAGCETGGTYNPRAVSKNGLWWGLFQQGSWQRSAYGFAWNAWAQARSAWKAFKDNGYCWTCNQQWPTCGRGYD